MICQQEIVVSSPGEVRRILGTLFLPEILQACAIDNNTDYIDINAVYNAYESRNDAYILHDGEEMEKIARMSAALQAGGLSVAVSPQKTTEALSSSYDIEGVYKQVMSDVDRAHCVLVCISSPLIKHIYDLTPHQHITHVCQMAFTYAKHRKGLLFMLPVVMSKDMRDSKEWGGQVGRVLGGKVRPDLAEEVSSIVMYLPIHTSSTWVSFSYLIYVGLLRFLHARAAQLDPVHQRKHHPASAPQPPDRT